MLAHVTIFNQSSWTEEYKGNVLDRHMLAVTPVRLALSRGYSTFD